MLAMADRHGRVFASAPGLANRARVTLEECKQALQTFLAPDPDSRTPENEGRRIAPIDGGWRLLNHAKYRDMRDEETRRVQNREAKQRQRNRELGDVMKNADSQQMSAQAETDTETEQEEKSIAQHASLFDAFWAVYPKRKGRKPALQRWRTQQLDAIAMAVISDVTNRARNDAEWLAGFIPDPNTYLKQERWMDEVQRPRHPKENPSASVCGRTPTAEEVLAPSRPKHPSSALTVRAALDTIEELLPPRASKVATSSNRT